MPFGAPHPSRGQYYARATELGAANAVSQLEKAGGGLNRLCIYRYASNSGRLDASPCVRGGAEERGGGVVMRNLYSLFSLPILWYAPKNRRRKGAGGSRQILNVSPLGTPLPTAFLRCGRGVGRSKTDAPPSLKDERRCGLVLRAVFGLNGGCECCSA